MFNKWCWENCAGSIPGLAQRVKDLHCRELWYRPAAAAPIRPLAWELPYATGEAIINHCATTGTPDKIFNVA